MGYVLRTHPYLTLLVQTSEESHKRQFYSMILKVKGQEVMLATDDSARVVSEQEQPNHSMPFFSGPPPSTIQNCLKVYKSSSSPQLLSSSSPPKAAFLAAVPDFSAPEEQASLLTNRTITSNVDKLGVEIETFPRNNKEFKPLRSTFHYLYERGTRKQANNITQLLSLQLLHLDRGSKIIQALGRQSYHFLKSLTKVHKTTSIPFVIEETTA